MDYIDLSVENSIIYSQNSQFKAVLLFSISFSACRCNFYNTIYVVQHKHILDNPFVLNENNFVYDVSE